MALEVGPLLPCPKCRRPLDAASWRDAARARCRYCENELEFHRFPAFDATTTVAKPQAVVLGEEATCFFHATNQAAAVCADCGRLLCPVCSVPHEQAVLCPACIAGRRKTQAQAVNSRFLWGGAALTVTVVPLLALGFGLACAGLGSLIGGEVNFFSILGGMIMGLAGMVAACGGPSAVALALVGLKKPGSIIAPRRWQHVVGLILGLLITGGLVLGIVAMVNKW